MLKNHFTIAFRRLLRHPGRTGLHVLGLGLGLAACFVVLLYATHELGYDRFHENGDRLYQVTREFNIGERVFRANGIDREEVATLLAQVPALEAVVETGTQEGLVRVPETGAVFEEKDVLFATSNLFEVFTFPLVRGDPAAVLDAPDGAVLTASLARKLFGTADPIGRTLTYEQGGLRADSTRTAYRVTGIAADPPGNSTLRFGLVLAAPPFDPDAEFSPVFLNAGYALVSASADTSALLAALAETTPANAQEPPQRVRLAPLATLHQQGREGDPQTLYFFGTMALFVLAIACINYTNLATAQAAQRGREIGIRKTLGASGALLRGQFLAEAVLLALAGGAVALALTLAAPAAFERFFGVTLAASPRTEPLLAGAMLVLALATGLAAGLYPAFVLARRRPVEALAGVYSGRARGRVRQALVVVQFALAIGMIAATLVVDGQLRFGQEGSLGFAGSQIVTLDLSAPALQKQNVALRDAVQRVPGVRQVARASAAPGGTFVGISGKPEGDDSPDLQGVITNILTAEPAYTRLFGLKTLAGRDLRDGEDRTAVVLNETAAREYGLMTGDPETAIGQKISLMGTREVVGVVEDFVYTSVRDAITPLALTLPTPDAEVSSGFVMVGSVRVLAVELEAGQVRPALAGIERAWQRIAPDYPFAYAFVDDAFAQALQAEARVRAVFGTAALLALLLACLGLFGLAAFAAEQRTKEIGVRKVLGASVKSLVALLSRDFALLVVAAFVVAAPLTFFLMQRWLERFAYRVDVGAGPLLVAGGVVLVLALATVSYHALRAARANPTQALRSE